MIIIITVIKFSKTYFSGIAFNQKCFRPFCGTVVLEHRFRRRYSLPSNLFRARLAIWGRFWHLKLESCLLIGPFVIPLEFELSLPTKTARTSYPGVIRIRVSQPRKINSSFIQIFRLLFSVSRRFG